MKKLNKKEKAFCRCFIDTGSILEAEKIAEIKDGSKLLNNSEIINELEKLSKLQCQGMSILARTGLKRLAIGGISDAVSLIYMDKPDREKLKEMDLFMISEIRRQKDGHMEIKFFDRFKALDKLIQNSEATDTSVPFYDALVMSAKSIEGVSNDN